MSLAPSRTARSSTPFRKRTTGASPAARASSPPETGGMAEAGTRPRAAGAWEGPTGIGEVKGKSEARPGQRAGRADRADLQLAQLEAHRQQLVAHLDRVLRLLHRFVGGDQFAVHEA